MAAVAQTATAARPGVYHLSFCHRFTQIAAFETALLGSSNGLRGLWHDLIHSGWSAPAVAGVDSLGLGKYSGLKSPTPLGTSNITWRLSVECAPESSGDFVRCIELSGRKVI